MYLTYLKTMIVDSLRQALDSTYPSIDFRNTYVSIEYPIEKQHYPGVWCNYEDQDTLTIAGIDHKEYVHDDPDDPTSPVHAVTRWMFSGEVTLTFVALSSLERDNLYDQFVRIFAFSRIENAPVSFRTVIETNDFIAANVNWDELHPHGDAAAPGTPWGTENEVINEKSVGFDIEGEFVSDYTQNELVMLSRIVITATNEDSSTNPAFVLGVPRTD